MGRPKAYYVDGERVPSVTTVLGQLGWGKDGLIYWAWRVGSEGKSLEEERQKAAGVGTITHARIEAELAGEPELDLSRVDPITREQSNTSYEAWGKWKARNVRRIIASELSLTSTVHKYGGTLDVIYEDTAGEIVLGDVKTGGAIYEEALLQVAGYSMLAIENKVAEIQRCEVIRLDRDSGSMTTKSFAFDPQGIAPTAFLLARDLYELHKRLKKEAK